MTSTPGFEICLSPAQPCSLPEPYPQNMDPKGAARAESLFGSFRQGCCPVCEGLDQRCLLASVPSGFLQTRETHPTGSTDLFPTGGGPSSWTVSRCGRLEGCRGLTIIIHTDTHLSSLPSTFLHVSSSHKPHNKPAKQQLAPCGGVVQIQVLLLIGYIALGQSLHFS